MVLPGRNPHGGTRIGGRTIAAMPGESVIVKITPAAVVIEMIVIATATMAGATFAVMETVMMVTTVAMATTITARMVGMAMGADSTDAHHRITALASPA